MQIKKLLQEDDAVSPVIGVILMVAITVILAAVIASFVLGLGGSQQQTPQASFSWDYNNLSNNDTSDSWSEGIVTVSHDSGDTIVASELQFRGNGYIGGNDDIDGDSNDEEVDIIKQGQWPGAQASGSQGDSTAVVSGDTVDIGVTSDFEMSLVWEPSEGDTSATLSEETGPDA